MHFDITHFGATGDGVTDDAPAIQRAIDACANNGGGRVVLPAGRTYLSGTILLRSFVDLHVESGATLAASPHDDAYTLRRQTSGLAGLPGQDTDFSTMLITAKGESCVSITGGGTIDGGGRHFVISDNGHSYEMEKVRPYTIYLIDCERVVIRDVVIRDGAYWTVRASGCRGVQIHDISIRNDTKLPNSDGIDIDSCQRVNISGCDIVTGDDGICLKTCRESTQYGNCEDVVVTNCTIVSTSSALCIGSETASPIRNVVFSACVISGTNRGITVQMVDGTDVSNVLFSDIVVETRFFDRVWWGQGEPIHVSVAPFRAASGTVRNIRFRNILARSEGGVVVHSDNPGCVSGLVFDGVRLEIDRWSGRPGGFWDLRPNLANDVVPHTTSGFHVEHVSDVSLRDCEVAFAQPDGQRSPDLRHAVELVAVEDLRRCDVRGTSADPGRWAAILRDGQPIDA
ncbi:MAG: glycosyl hydrolase family 28 protein [Arachnia sp.]